jgi:hypothetical protein
MAKKPGIPVQWLKDKAEGKEDLERTLRNSTYVLGKLKTILKDELLSIDKAETTITDFDEPNWANKQAFRNGRKAGLTYTLSLLEFIP